MIKFKAHFGGAKVDKEGEVKITLIVPQTDAAKAIALTMVTGTVFDVAIVPEVEGLEEVKRIE
jgi:hypothetical protein